MAAPLTVSFILKAIDRATAPMRRVTKNFEAMRKAKIRADRAFAQAANIRGAAEGVSRFASTMRSALAAPINEFEAFESAMASVRAMTSGITDNEFAALIARAEDLGATTRFTATQAAEGFSFFAKAGFDAAKQLEVLPTTMDLATASGSDLGRTADIVSDILGQFQLDAKETGRVANVMARTFTGANVTLETMFESFKFVAPVAKQFNASVEETSALVGLLGGVGIKGSQAGTALKGMFAKLAAPRRRGQKILEGLLDIDTATATGELRKIPDILAEIIAKTNKMGTKKRGAVFARIFGLEGFTSAGALAAMGKDQIDAFTREVTEGTTTVKSIAGIMDDTAKGATVRLTSAMSGLNIVVGKELAPSLTQMKEALTGSLQAMTKLAAASPRLTKTIGGTLGVVTLLATGLTGILFAAAAMKSAIGVMIIGFAAIKTAVIVLIPILQTLLIRIVSFTAFVIAKAIAATFSLATAFFRVAAGALAAAAPFIAIAAAIGSVVLAVVELKKHWEELDFLKAGKGIFQTVFSREEGALKAIGRLFDPTTLLRDIGVIDAPTITAPTSAAAPAATESQKSESVIEVRLAQGLEAASVATKGVAAKVKAISGPAGTLLGAT